MQFTQVSELDLQLEVPLLVPDTVGSFSRLPNFTDPIAERLVAMLPDSPSILPATGPVNATGAGAPSLSAAGVHELLARSGAAMAARGDVSPGPHTPTGDRTPLVDRQDALTMRRRPPVTAAAVSPASMPSAPVVRSSVCATTLPAAHPPLSTAPDEKARAPKQAGTAAARQEATKRHRQVAIPNLKFTHACTPPHKTRCNARRLTHPLLCDRHRLARLTWRRPCPEILEALEQHCQHDPGRQLPLWRLRVSEPALADHPLPVEGQARQRHEGRL